MGIARRHLYYKCETRINAEKKHPYNVGRGLAPAASFVFANNRCRGGSYPPAIFIISKHSKRGYTRFDFCENEQATKGLLLWEKVAAEG